MTEVIGFMVIGLFGMGAALKGVSWFRRWRVVSQVDPSTITREARGVSMRVSVQGLSLIHI